MSPLEISIIVIFSAGTLLAFLLYFINSQKIKKAKKKQAEAEKQKQEEEKKAEENAKKNSEKEKQASPKKDVVEAVADNSAQPAVAIVEETTQQEQPSTEALNGKVEEKTPAKANKTKSIKQQIDNLSPELKAILLTDIIKPKY